MKLNLPDTVAPPVDADLSTGVIEAPEEPTNPEKPADDAELGEGDGEGETPEPAITPEPAPAPASNGKGTDGTPTGDKGAFDAKLEDYIEQFGKDKGVDYFLAEMDLATAQAAHIQSLGEEVQDLKNKLEVSESTEGTPLSGNHGEGSTRAGFASKITIA